MIKDYDYRIKLILIGRSGVGKTSILTQFADNKFRQNSCPTIGVDFCSKIIKHENKNIKFQIWDTAGHERFRAMISANYKGADGIIMVYDVTDPSSLEDIEQFWIPEAYNYCDRSIDVILLGNKSDCPSTIVPNVIFENIQKLQTILDNHGFTHVNVSAKNDDKIYNSIIDFGIRIIMKKNDKEPQRSGPETSINSSQKSGNTKPQPSNQPIQAMHTQSQFQQEHMVEIINNIENYKKQCIQLQQLTQQKRKQKNLIQQQTSSTRQTLNSLKQQVKQIQSQIETLTPKLTKLQHQTKQQQNTISQLQQKQERLQQRQRQYEDKKNQLINDIQRLQQQQGLKIKQFQNNQKKLVARLDHVRQEIQAIRRQKQKYTGGSGQMLMVSRQEENWEHKYEELNQRYNQLDQQYKKETRMLKEHLDTHENKLFRVRNELRKMEKELQQYKQFKKFIEKSFSAFKNI